MSEVTPFKPAGPTIAVAVGTSSAKIDLPVSGSGQYRIVTTGTAIPRIEIGTPGSSPVATIPAPGTPGSMGLLPNSSEVFNIQAGSAIAFIAAATGTTVEITPGEGL